MNSFGLGLILNFTDRASSGLNSATRSFQQMSATADAVSSSVSTSITDIVTASYALDSVGTTLMQTGSSIIGVFANVSQSVIDSGMQMQGYRMQLSALYGSVEAGEAKIQEIKDYAMSSVFDIQSLIPAVTTMKAVGIEAMNEITTSSGQNTQKLLDYASDLAAMMPNMRNVYGTGVSAAMGAFKEYIAEGNALSLKRGAGLDITAILGEDKGASIEERTQQVADLIEKLNVVGYTANLAGTPTQRLSNMQDALFNSLTKIADSGVFEKYCDLLEKLSDWVFSLVEDEETFNTITGVLADTITTLLSPLNSLLDFVIKNSNAIIGWIKEHPKLTKNILVTVAAIGAFLVAGGMFLKLLSSIGMASAGFSFLKTLPTLLSTVGTAFKGLITKALPFVALASVAYFAWSQNLFGIRDAATKVMNDLGNIFSLVGAAWDDNTLTEEEFQKAKDLGILPLIEALLQLKYYWGFLVDGFKEGFKAFFEGIVETLNQLGIIDVDINTLIASIGEFLRSLVDVGAEDKWSSIGKSLGEIAASLLTITVVLSSLKAIIPVIKGIGTIFNIFIIKPFSFIGKLFKPMITGFKNILTVLKGGQGVTFFSKLLEVMKAVLFGGMKLKDAMTVVFGGTATVIGGVVSLVTGVATATVAFVKQLKDGFSWIWEIIKWIGIALGVVGAILLGVAALPAVIVGAIVGALTTIIVLVKQYWNEICAFFVFIGNWIYDNVIKPIADFFVNLWNGIVNGVKSAISAISNFFSTLASWIYNNVIQPIANFFVGLWNGLVDGVMFVVNAIVSFFSTIANWIYENVISPIVWFFTSIIFPIIAKIVEIVMKIIEIIVVLVTVLVKWIYNNVIKPIGDFFVGLWQSIVDIFMSIVDFFVGLWNSIVSIFMSIVEGIKSVFNTVVGWINANIIQPIANFFVGLWNGIVSGVTAFISAVKSVINTIVSWINNTIIQPIANFFVGLWNGIVSGVTAFIETVKSIFHSIVDWIKTSIIDPIANFFQSLWEGIQFAFNTVVDAITSVFKSIINTVLDFICGLINGLINGINWAIDVINKIPGVNITKIDLLEIPRLAEGGVVDKPTLAEIGEDGQEAVVPLENNTGWIDKVAEKVAPKLAIVQEKKGLSTNTPKQEVHNDYSVTFAAGSIVIQLVNATEAELEKAADKLMKIIERKQQLKALAVR